MQKIGLIDYDTSFARTYFFPNYDLGVTYAHYVKEPNTSVRLITTLTPENLSGYDLIFLFRRSPLIPHPSGRIADYYKYPIRECGPGFPEAPLRPLLMETRELAPNFKCYNPILAFSLDNPKHASAWHLLVRTRKQNYPPVKLYEEVDGEILKKDFPPKGKSTIHDDPMLIFNSPTRWADFCELGRSGRKFVFAQDIDINLIQDTNVLEQIVFSPTFASFGRTLGFSSVEGNAEFILKQYLDPETTRPHRSFYLWLDPSDTDNGAIEKAFKGMYYKHSCKKVDLYPAFTRERKNWGNDLAHHAINYFYKNKNNGSFYEYYLCISLLREGADIKSVFPGEAQIEYLLDKYGAPQSLISLEAYMQDRPGIFEGIFLGGQSNYEQQRRKYFDKGRSRFAFGGDTYDASSYRSAREETS